MKVIVLNDKSAIIRHWWRWYHVQRNGTRWQLLDPIIMHGKPLKFPNSIDHAAESLSKAGKGGEVADILR